MLDRLTSMEVFAQAVRCGSLSGAARVVGISPTMATKHVNALEDRLGVKLVHRTTRQITLTDAGRRYLDSVEKVLADLARADASAAAERDEVEGVLRVTVPVSFGIREIAPLLPELADLYPRLTIDLGISDAKVDMVAEGWDVAVRIGHNPDDTSVARKLAPCRLLVAAAPSYLAARGIPRTVAALSEHECLSYTLSSHLERGRWRFGKDGRITVPVSGRLRAGNGDILVAAALAGQGVIYQPSFLLGEHLRAGRLVALRLDHPPAEIPGVYAAYPATRRAPAKVRAFIEFMATRFGSPPPWDRDLEFQKS
ncbi:LysR family transcriptional regulator [Paracoccus seriniphilus]|uniref:DNA-binding transcriptional regulator, LysR family n=1 Tax=Paracoccus seriniphilus TaxID=184748 RepID=A0A239PTV1_9RHOB|nr:LysR family transcriptional regulator [Paracoccus seriniphilus]WCR16523.1 LysR family transcriptional regulator [Paracoccus seriniphilus]SNT73729.1 DNA-binding transcriptional regulator, LysR family [Paracoccus seriniphilus]